LTIEVDQRRSLVLVHAHWRCVPEEVLNDGAGPSIQHALGLAQDGAQFVGTETAQRPEAEIFVLNLKIEITAEAGCGSTERRPAADGRPVGRGA
jgi:hypothetical protein